MVYHRENKHENTLTIQLWCPECLAIIGWILPGQHHYAHKGDNLNNIACQYCKALFPSQQVIKIEEVETNVE